MLRFIIFFVCFLNFIVIKSQDLSINTENISDSRPMDERGFYVKIGDTLENINFTLDNGKAVSLHELRGKVVMLQFTASWCGVCREEMPHIENEIWKKYKDKGLYIIGVDYDEPLEKVLAFKEQTKISYPLALDPDAKIFTKIAGKKSGVTRNVIIDKNGKIIFLTRLFKIDEFNKMIEIIDKELKS
jgi:peroxiredoxin